MDSVWGTLRFLQLGVQSNCFGLECPAHCGSPFAGALVASFLGGFLVCLVLVGAFGLRLLGFAWFPVLRWNPHPLALLDCPAICVSQPPTQDNDVVELALGFAGLSISVRGSTDSAASFARGLSAGSVTASSAAPSFLGSAATAVPAQPLPQALNPRVTSFLPLAYPLSLN